MDESISAAKASLSFSRLLRDLRAGHSFALTPRRTPVARLLPRTAAEATQEVARMTLLKRLGSQPVVDIGQWSRDELYDC